MSNGKVSTGHTAGVSTEETGVSTEETGVSTEETGHRPTRSRHSHGKMNIGHLGFNTSLK